MSVDLIEKSLLSLPHFRRAWVFILSALSCVGRIFFLHWMMVLFSMVRDGNREYSSLHIHTVRELSSNTGNVVFGKGVLSIEICWRRV